MKSSNKISLIEETKKITKYYCKKKIFKNLQNEFLKKKITYELYEQKIKIEKKDKIRNYKLQNYERSNQDTVINQTPLVHKSEWITKGDIIADGSSTKKGELSLGKNILIAYMPWEGYNFEDAIVISENLITENLYTSIHIEKYEIKIQQTPFGPEEITRKIPNIQPQTIKNLDKNGVILPGTLVKKGDIIVGKIAPKNDLNQSPEGQLLRAIFGKNIGNIKNTSLLVPPGADGRVIRTKIIQKTNVLVYIAQKKKIKKGDKVSGRHGNKGIISEILPRQDMPYLQDGKNVDMILNPLGVPSRMNVGQVFESLLGMCGFYLKENYRITPFDEMYGNEISKRIVFNKLYETKEKTGKRWIFNPNSPGKTRLFDGRSGQSFDQPITIGYSYMLKLIHLVDKKIHARSIGPYSLVTQQPLRGRAKEGGQRLGEMEVWALEGFGAAYNLQELLTVKSDDIQGRNNTLKAIV